MSGVKAPGLWFKGKYFLSIQQRTGVLGTASFCLALRAPHLMEMSYGPELEAIHRVFMPGLWLFIPVFFLFCF